MASDSSAVRRLAARLLQVERGLRNVSTVPQLGRSSLDDEALTLRDGEGNVMGRVGRQEDGTYGSTTLDGPTPVAPVAPSASGGPGSLTVEWDGQFKDGTAAPLDFHVVEIYVATEPFTTIGDARLLGHFSNEAGGEITVARPTGVQHVGLVTKARSGKRSELSPLATAVVESVVDQETVDELNDALENMPSITWLNRAPEPADGEGKPVGAVWRELNDAGEIVGEFEWDGAAWVARPISGDAVTHLEVGKLTAAFSQLDEVVANRIFTDIFAANQVTASEIATETLGADAGFIGVLNSAEIVGALIKTAASGGRVQLDAEGLRTFNDDGDETTRLIPSGDGLSIDGPDGGTFETVHAPNGSIVRIRRPSVRGFEASEIVLGPSDVGTGDNTLNAASTVLMRAGGKSFALLNMGAVIGESWIDSGWPIIVKADTTFEKAVTHIGRTTFPGNSFATEPSLKQWNAPPGTKGWAVGTDREYVRRSDRWDVENAARDLGTMDLNEVTFPGTYTQQTPTPATPERNYPEQRHGTLTVVSRGIASSIIEQRYVTIGNSTTPGREYYRTRDGTVGGWSPWAWSSREGGNAFSTPAQRDAVLSSPSDGMEAYTGSGANLTKWVRVNNQWVKVWDDETSTDTGWVDLATYIATGYSGNLSARKAGNLVEIKFNVDGSFPAGNTTFTNALPSQFRPTGSNSYGTAYTSGGHPGVSFARPAGTLGAAHQAPSARTSALGSIMFLAG